jgi:hypothetical protein
MIEDARLITSHSFDQLARRIGSAKKPKRFKRLLMSVGWFVLVCVT